MINLRVSLLFLMAGSVSSAAIISYTGGYTNTSGASGPSWVGATSMFLNLIETYGGAPGPSGATGSSSSDFALFDGGLDVTQLSWTFGSMTLQGVGVGDSITQSPGIATPGYEDYRKSGGGDNLTFTYNGTDWASGEVTRFVIEVDNNADSSAIGYGVAVLNTVLDGTNGQAFYDEISTLTGGTMEILFDATNFNPVVVSDPATFSSDGTLTFVPEPSAWALVPALVLGVATLRRPKR